jgi:hypothetical protein
MIDRSQDPYYQALFWCYEAQQYFRWDEMMRWYEENSEEMPRFVGAPV